MVFIVSLYAYYFTEGDSSFLLDGLDRFSHHLYNMESLYRAVSITILAIIPLATSLRIAAIAWFWFRKSKISFYTVTYHPVYSFVCSMYESTFIYIYKKQLKIQFVSLQILIFIPVWTLGEIVVLCYTSYILRLVFFYLSFY